MASHRSPGRTKKQRRAAQQIQDKKMLRKIGAMQLNLDKYLRRLSEYDPFNDHLLAPEPVLMDAPKELSDGQRVLFMANAKESYENDMIKWLNRSVVVIRAALVQKAAQTWEKSNPEVSDMLLDLERTGKLDDRLLF